MPRRTCPGHVTIIRFRQRQSISSLRNVNRIREPNASRFYWLWSFTWWRDLPTNVGQHRPVDFVVWVVVLVLVTGIFRHPVHRRRALDIDLSSTLYSLLLTVTVVSITHSTSELRNSISVECQWTYIRRLEITESLLDDNVLFEIGILFFVIFDIRTT